MSLRASDAPIPHSVGSLRSFALDDQSRAPGFPRSQHYPPEVELFRQGNPAEEVFYIERGLVKLLRSQASGEERIVGLRSSGWFLGAAAVVIGMPLTVTAITVRPCRVARLEAAEFCRQLRENSAISWRLHEMHSREVYNQTIQVADLMSDSARQRLKEFLWRLAPAAEALAAENPVRVDVPLKQWEIAQLIGVTPPYLCQLMSELESDGELRRENGGLVLLHRPGENSPPRPLTRTPPA